MQAHLDIYIPRDFQWYKDCKIQWVLTPTIVLSSIRTLTPKVGVHVGVWGFIPSHSLTLPRTWDVTPRLPSWPAPFQALALVMRPKLRLQHIVSIQRLPLVLLRCYCIAKMFITVKTCFHLMINVSIRVMSWIKLMFHFLCFDYY
jgi:hypothetical protein